MPNVIETVLPMMCKTVEYAPIGTNLGLLYLIWALISGQFLESRGGIFPALAQLGLPKAAVRRSWAALNKGGWQIGKLIVAWRAQVEAAGRWQAVRVDGYRVKAGDMSAVFRPCLQACPSKHYNPIAEKALPAVEIGLCVDVGKVGKQIVPLPALLVQPLLAKDTQQLSSTAQLKAQLIEQISQQQQSDELYLFDPEFTPAELVAAGLRQFVTRLAKNCVVRRNQLPDYDGRGRPPEYGEMVRPLARSYKGKRTPATPADESYSWTESVGRILTIQLWHTLVLSSQKVEKDAPTFTIALIQDPRFKDPWLLFSSFPLTKEAWPSIYRFRWTVERPPLIAKSLLGAARQYVHSIDVSARLFALSLLAGCMLAYFAAIFPPIPSGFWDRNPKPTAGRFRRLLSTLPFSAFPMLPERFRIKASPTHHLPKGVLAHRRSTSSLTPAFTGN
jgi:hypothetical protein